MNKKIKLLKGGYFTLLTALYFVNPFNSGFLFGYLIFILLFFNKNFIKENMDFDVVLLSLFSVIYSLFYALDPEFGIQFILIYALFPPTFYLMGKYLCNKAESETVLFQWLIILGFLLSFSALVSILLVISENGLGQINRSLPLIWGEDLVSATVMGSFFTLNMCIPALLVVRQVKLSLLTKVLMILLFVLSLLCILRIGTRTQIVISLFTLFMALIYIVPKQSLKKNIIMFFIFIGGVALIIQNVNFDLSSDWLSAFADRMDNNNGADITSGGGRTSRWSKSLENLFTKPLGWSVEEFGYSHNLWLDVLRASGVIPFLLLVIYGVRSFLKVKRITKLNKVMLSFFNQIRVYALALFLLFMVEPIFEGMFATFIVFCFLMGVITQFESRYNSVIHLEPENKKNENQNLVNKKII